MRIGQQDKSEDRCNGEDRYHHQQHRPAPLLARDCTRPGRRALKNFGGEIGRKIGLSQERLQRPLLQFDGLSLFAHVGADRMATTRALKPFAKRSTPPNGGALILSKVISRICAATRRL